MTPGCARNLFPPSSTFTVRQWRATSTRRPSVTACPESDVPAARSVIGTFVSRARRKSEATSSTVCARTTAFGISR